MTELQPYSSKPSSDRNTTIGGVLLIVLLTSLIATSGLPALALPGLTKNYETYFFANRTLFWISLLLIWLYAVKVEKQPLLIWKEKRQEVLHYILAIVCLLVATAIGVVLLHMLMWRYRS
jgi:membrane protease YdiL (CAAX protease family)